MVDGVEKSVNEKGREWNGTLSKIIGWRERELFICVYNHTILLKQQSSLGEHTHRYAFLNEHAFIDIKGIVVEEVRAEREREQNHCYCIELQTIKAIHMEIE